MKHSYPTLEPLKFLLQLIQNREMALPDFQRDFVWDPSATDELIESIINNFPAGSLLRIQNGFQLLFQPRQFEGAPVLENTGRPSYLILDGQQRLTSLYQAFYGAGEHRYFVDLNGLESNKDLEDCVFYLRKEEGQARYGTISQQAVSLTFPLSKVFGNGGFNSWVPEVLKERCKDMAEMLDLQGRLTRLYEQWIKPIEEYEFPMVTLNEGTSASAVCTIFETLNRTGIKLSVFELLTARFWAQDLNLRKLWDDAKAEFSIIEDYEIDPYYLIQIIALLEPGSDKDDKPLAPSIKRSSILDMKVEQARKGWDKAVNGLAEILEILRGDCGVLISGLLPYNTMIIPMAAVWVAKKDMKGAEEGASRIKLLRWFWCSVFGQQYENAPNSQAERDYAELRRWMDGGDPPASVVDFNIGTLRMRSVRPRQRAIYRGTMALILDNGAMDFHNRGRITASLLADKRNPIDDHHIFPQAFLNDNQVPAALRDCILNRTYIDRITNRRLSRRSPSDYFQEIRNKHGEEQADQLLRSHLLPAGDNSALHRDDFESFLVERERNILTLISQKTGSALANVLVDNDTSVSQSLTFINKKRAARQGKWDEQSFFEQLEKNVRSTSVDVARDLTAWASRFSDLIWSGVNGICTPTIERDGSKYPLFAIRSEGQIVLRFARLRRRKVFQERELQLEMLRRFNEVPNLHFEEESLRRKPNFEIEILTDPHTLDRFKTAVNWVADQVKEK